MVNMDIETDARICKLMETSKVSILDPHIGTRSEHADNVLYISGALADYTEEHVSDLSEDTATLKGNTTRQFFTTFLNHCYNDLCQDRNKFKDHAATHFNSCQSFREYKPANLTTNDFKQFTNEMKLYSLKNE